MKNKRFFAILALILAFVCIMFSSTISVNAAACKTCGSDDGNHYCTRDCTGKDGHKAHHDKAKTITNSNGTTEAAKICPLCAHYHNYNDFMVNAGKKAYTKACEAHGGLFSMDIPTKDPDTESDVFDIDVLLEMSPSGAFAPVFSLGETLYQSIATLGSILVFIYFLLELGETQMNDGFTYETLTKHTIKTILAFLLISNGFMLIEGGVEVCASILARIAQTASSGVNAPFDCTGCPYWPASNDWLFGPFGVNLRFIIPNLFLWVCTVMTKVIIWARIIDVVTRIVLAPIGMADVIKLGMASNGIKYFKKLLASVLQGACIFGVILAYNEICGVISGSLSGFMGAIVLALATLTVIKQTSNIANSIIGV